MSVVICIMTGLLSKLGLSLARQLPILCASHIAILHQLGLSVSRLYRVSRDEAPVAAKCFRFDVAPQPLFASPVSIIPETWFAQRLFIVPVV